MSISTYGMSKSVRLVFEKRLNHHSGPPCAVSCRCRDSALLTRLYVIDPIKIAAAQIISNLLLPSANRPGSTRCIQKLISSSREVCPTLATCRVSSLEPSHSLHLVVSSLSSSAEAGIFSFPFPFLRASVNVVSIYVIK
jgi:hypothetical protein